VLVAARTKTKEVGGDDLFKAAQKDRSNSHALASGLNGNYAWVSEGGAEPRKGEGGAGGEGYPKPERGDPVRPDMLMQEEVVPKPDARRVGEEKRKRLSLSRRVILEIRNQSQEQKKRKRFHFKRGGIPPGRGKRGAHHGGAISLMEC